MEKKYKINLVGDSFTHLTGGNRGYSVPFKTAKYIEWVKDPNLFNTFYIDCWINQAFTDGISGTKYAWLLESKFVTPTIVEEIKFNHEEYFKIFKYIFTHNKELLDLDDRFKWCPANGYWIKEPKIYPKTKMISFITSNKSITDGHKERIKWVDMLGDQVDLYGRGFNEIESKEEGLCDYMFSVVIENGVYESYFTEKILDCFATGTIPVYLGSPDIHKHFNMDGIILLSNEFDISEEIYYNKMEYIKDNLKRTQEIEVPEDFIYKNYLEKEL
jgi:hypothetical protein